MLFRSAHVNSFSTFYATVVDRVHGETFLVQGLGINDINHRGRFMIPVTSDTLLFWHNVPISLNDIHMGARISITYGGSVIETDPAQIEHTYKLIVMDDNIEGDVYHEPYEKHPSFASCGFHARIFQHICLRNKRFER